METISNERLDEILSKPAFTREPRMKVITCEHTGHKVLYDIPNDICLHNDTIEEDLAEVERFEKGLAL